MPSDHATRPAGRTTRRLLGAAGALLRGAVAAVLLAELACRVFDPYGAPSQAYNGQRYQQEAIVLDIGNPRIFWQRADLDLEFRTFRLRTDGRGFRGRERGLEKPPGVRRILFLGDSVVHGWGVSDEDTSVHLVEQGLNEREDPWEWQTINSAAPGYDSAQALATFEQVGQHYDPDLVVLVYVDNDIIPTRLLFEVGADMGRGVVEMSAEARRVLRRMELLGKAS